MSSIESTINVRKTTLLGRLGTRRPGRAILLCALLMAGCGAPVAKFEPNLVYRKKQELTANVDAFPPTQISDLQVALASLFGSPDDPNAPLLAEIDTTSVINKGKLVLAAGPVKSDKEGRVTGLYRKHCVHCHGITGDGKGPTAAALNPYPRDFRMGIYKFKSTPKGSKPTHDDLKKTLKEGIAGTAMPSFRLLDEGELDSLVNYVKYLSIRGEVERKLLIALTDLDEKDRLIDLGAKKESPDAFSSQVERLRGVTAGVVTQWQKAASEVSNVPARPEGWDEPDKLAASVKRGRELFYGSIANCFSCHGDSALGDGQQTDHDDWTKELEPKDPKKLRAYLALELPPLPPRTIKPRNLRLGVYRGGRRPIDLYWRISNGIEGVPMPNAQLKTDQDPPEAKKLTPEDVWSLVDYVRSLPNETISRPPPKVAENLRERS